MIYYTCYPINGTVFSTLGMLFIISSKSACCSISFSKYMFLSYFKSSLKDSSSVIDFTSIFDSCYIAAYSSILFPCNWAEIVLKTNVIYANYLRFVSSLILLFLYLSLTSFFHYFWMSSKFNWFIVSIDIKKCKWLFAEWLFGFLDFFEKMRFLRFWDFGKKII